MKSLLVFPVLAAALMFCGITERIQQLVGSQSNTTVANSSSPQGGGDKNIVFERPEPSAQQKSMIDGGKEIKWDEQGMSWRVPQGWRELRKERNMFLWMSADNSSLIVNISPMSGDFPVDASVKPFYDGAVTRMKNGEVEKVRFLEIDGVKGVEFIETKADSADDPRRHQWIAYRKYAGQTQMLNLMTATKAGAFDKHRDEFAAILYSTKIINQE
jgi:hypothetical protein